MSNYRMYDVDVQTLTPLHIGTGRELLKDFDFAVRGSRTYRLNEDAILEEKGADDAAAAAVLAGTPPAHLIEDLLGTAAGDAFVRYSLRGVPRTQGTGARLREQIKSAYDEVYLPGSSIKGALRTSLLRALWAQKAMKPASAALGRNAKFEAQPIEKELMGRDPNHDLLRALPPAARCGVMCPWVCSTRALSRAGALAATKEDRRRLKWRPSPAISSLR